MNNKLFSFFKKSRSITQVDALKSSNKLDPLLALRSFAFFLVLFHHIYIIFKPQNWPFTLIVGDNNFTWFMQTSAHVGVWIFFCLSGYLMGKAFYSGRYSLTRKGIANFWLNRFLKIAPLYYFNILVCSMILLPNEILGNLTAYLSMLTFTYNGHSSINPNGALWSISTEFQYYLLVPFIVMFLAPLLKSKKQIIAVLIFLFAIELRFKHGILMNCGLENWDRLILTPLGLENWGRFILTPLSTNIDLFIAGFCVNNLLAKSDNFKINNKTLKWLKLCSIFLLFAFCLLTSYISFYVWMIPLIKFNFLYFLIFPILTAFTVMTFIYLFEYEKIYSSPINKNQDLTLKTCLKNPLRLIEICGILTYGLYLWHPLVLTLVQKYFFENNFIEKVGLTLILTFILSALTYMVIEKPMQSLKKFNI